jgi:hypothetical protein
MKPLTWSVDDESLPKIREVLDACRDDTALFQEAVLGRRLWAKQVEVCDAIAKYPITVVPAGRAVGKSFLMAGIVLWWIYTRRRARVITTGPDFRQVVSVLWAELRAALAPRRDDSGRLVSPRVPLTYDHLSQGYASPQQLVLGVKWEALGFASDTDTGFSGQHSPEQLVIVDEASGVGLPTWGGIDGSASKRIVVVGNPIKYDCRFRELHDLAEAGSPSIHSVTISSLDHPHARLEHSPIGAVDKQFLRNPREIHGEEPPWWRSNILGLFPGQESVRFLPTPWLDACTRPEVTGDELWRDFPPGPARAAVDVGGGVGADRSVILIRNNEQILEVFASEWHGVLDDARHRLEPVVLDLVAKWQVRPDRVTYDKGGLGRSFGSYLEREQRRRIDAWHAEHPDAFGRPDLAPRPFAGAIGYFGAGKGGKLYVNRRTANAYAIKRRLDPHRDGHVPFYCSGIPEWPALRHELAELRSPTMEIEEGCVKQVLVAKATLMERLHRSPDLLDAFLMTFTYSE